MSDWPIAILLGSILPAGLALLWYQYRRYSYRRFNYLNSPNTLWCISIYKPGNHRGASEPKRSAYWQHHKRAVRLQNRYHFLLAFSISSLMVGFLLLAASVTVAESAHVFTVAFVLADVVCFLGVLLSFYTARIVNRAWIEARIRSELLRQNKALSALMDDVHPSPEASNSVALINQINKALVSHESRIDAVRSYWQLKRAEYIHSSVKSIESKARANTYIVERVRKQANWFYASKCRIKSQFKLRSALLVLLFFAVFLAAVVKALSVSGISWPWISENPNMFSFLVFLLLGMAIWLTALFVGQNTTSLYYRYDEQESRIVSWLNKWVRPKFSDGSFEGVLSLESVLVFEDSMIDELVAWLEITDKEKMELSPI